MTSSQVDTHRISKAEIRDTSKIESISLSSSNMCTGTPSSAELGANLPSQKKSLSFILAFLSIMASEFIATMDTVIVATALPAIAHDLNAQSNSAYWIGSSFLFAQAVSQPLYGTMSDFFGRKACYLFAMGVFTLASLCCALAMGAGWLIAARVFQGLGSGGIQAVGSIIITDMVTLRERGKYIGILALASALGLISGILMGAAIAGRSSWRIIFWINLPLGVPALVGIYFFINLESEVLSVKERLKRVDWGGIVILTGSLISLLFGVTSGGVLSPWDSASVISSIVIGVLGTIVFLFYEWKIAAEPMIPLRIFGNRTAGSAYVSCFVLGFVLWAMQYYLILYFLVTQRHSLVGAGVAILPGTAFIPIAAVGGGIIISKMQRFRTVNSIAWLLVTIGFSLMTQLKINSHKGIQYGFQVIQAIGGGMLFPGRLCAVQASELDADVPMATAMVSFITSLGQAFGVGIGGVVFQNQWNKKIQEELSLGRLSPGYIISYREAEQAAERIRPFPADVQTTYRILMADVIDTLFVVLAAFSAAALIVSLVSRNLSMDRETRSLQQFKEKKKVEKGQY